MKSSNNSSLGFEPAKNACVNIKVVLLFFIIRDPYLEAKKRTPELQNDRNVVLLYSNEVI